MLKDLIQQLGRQKGSSILTCFMKVCHLYINNSLRTQESINEALDWSRPLVCFQIVLDQVPVILVCLSFPALQFPNFGNPKKQSLYIKL